MNCIKCEKEVKKLQTENGVDFVDSGIIETVSANYGSVHDGHILEIAICDDCIQDNPHLIRIKDNYMNWITDIA